jgi:endonuclease YncB( thermonuclease family)
MRNCGKRWNEIDPRRKFAAFCRPAYRERRNGARRVKARHNAAEARHLEGVAFGQDRAEPARMTVYGITLASSWLATMLLSLMVITSPASAADLIGQASIIDGDTIEIHGTRIRLWGIDAPEHDQLCRNDDSDLYRCGAKAANDLDTFIAHRPVTCAAVRPDSRDLRGRRRRSRRMAGRSGARAGLAALLARPL